MIAIGVDTGGTFTDFIFKDSYGWGVYKVLSTPHDPAEAVLKGLSQYRRQWKNTAYCSRLNSCHQRNSGKKGS